MLAPAIVRALKHPPFDLANLTVTEWDQADDKAWFASHVVRFLIKDCPETLFTNCFYDRWHCCLEFMAEYNSVQFHETHFATDAAKACFLDQVQT